MAKFIAINEKAIRINTLSKIEDKHHPKILTSYQSDSILYFIFIGKIIVVLHAFPKKTDKTPEGEIRKAEENYYDVLKNYQIYE